jgi:NDP-sugar pyrophosphorylase family protein
MYEMNAIILCGGQGIRLRPLTVDIPKPLVPVRGRPIIDLIIEFLRNQAVTEITVAGGYLVDKLEQHFEGDQAVKVVDTGDCDIIERLKVLLIDGASETLVAYGDTLSDVNLKELLKAHQSSGREVTVTVWPLKSSFGVFDLDGYSNVTSYAEKPELDKWINIGYFILSQLAIKNLQQFKSFEAFLSDLTLRNQLHAFKHRGIHVTINSRAELEEAENLLAP